MTLLHLLLTAVAAGWPPLLIDITCPGRAQSSNLIHAAAACCGGR